MATVSKSYDYGDVIISLENCILSKEQIESTPSTRDGLDKEVEIDLRIVSCEYIQMAGILLKLPQVAMATAQVLFQRFYYSKSLIKHDAEIYAMASIFLAAKIEECPRRIRDVINVFHHIKQNRNGRTIQPMEYMGNHYFVLKNQVIKAERRILKELGFCVHVKHPHKVIIMYLQILECHTNQMLAQQAWNFMNDSFRTNIFVRYSPETIGCACIFLSARQLGICLPLRPPWWELFGAKLEDLEEISLTLLALYMRPKANLETLQKAVAELRKEVAQKKTDSKTDTGANFTPNISPSGGSVAARPESRPGSRPASPSKISPPSAATALDSKKKKSVSSKDEDKRTSNRERPTARATRQSRSPVDERPHRRTRSRSHSRSRSRSRSYSISISPDSITRSESESSDESPEKRRVPDKGKRRRSPDRGKDNERRARQRRYDDDYNRKQSKSDGSVNAARREKTRERSRSPFSRSRSRSRSPSREKVKRARVKYDQGRDVKRKDDRHRERNGVDYRARDKGRDHGRHRR